MSKKETLQNIRRDFVKQVMGTLELDKQLCKSKFVSSAAIGSGRTSKFYSDILDDMVLAGLIYVQDDMIKLVGSVE